MSSREERARRKITRLFQADAGDVDPLGRDARESYPVVVSCYCADSATDVFVICRRYMSNISSMVAKEGLFITAALRKARYYKVGERYFPSAGVDERDLEMFLHQMLGEKVVIEAHVLPSHEALGYTGIVLAYAVKRPSSSAKSLSHDPEEMARRRDSYHCADPGVHSSLGIETSRGL